MKYVVRKGFVYWKKGKAYPAGDVVEIEEGQPVSHQLAIIKEPEKAAEKAGEIISKPKRSSKRRKTAVVETAEAGE